MTILISLLYLASLLAQLDWWLWGRDAASRQDDKVWAACLWPGGVVMGCIREPKGCG
jgi:hypothetical protein